MQRKRARFIAQRRAQRIGLNTRAADARSGAGKRRQRHFPVMKFDRAATVYRTGVRAVRFRKLRQINIFRRIFTGAGIRYKIIITANSSVANSRHYFRQVHDVSAIDKLGKDILQRRRAIAALSQHRDAFRQRCRHCAAHVHIGRDRPVKRHIGKRRHFRARRRQMQIQRRIIIK